MDDLIGSNATNLQVVCNFIDRSLWTWAMFASVTDVVWCRDCSALMTADHFVTLQWCSLQQILQFQHLRLQKFSNCGLLFFLCMLPLLVVKITQRDYERRMGRTQCHKFYLNPSPFCHGQHLSLLSYCSTRWKLTNMMHFQLIMCTHKGHFWNIWLT
jgi:hypothetical protein